MAKLQAPLLAVRRHRREYFRRLTPRIAPAETRAMIEHELAILWSIEDSPRGSVPMWRTLTSLAKAFTRSDYVQTVHPERQRFLGVLQRLIGEEKVYRFRYRRRDIRVNDILLTDHGLQQLYCLRGIAPPDKWAAKPRQQQGPTLDEFLAAPEYYKVPDKWSALSAGEAGGIVNVATVDLLPQPTSVPTPEPINQLIRQRVARPAPCFIV